MTKDKPVNNSNKSDIQNEDSKTSSDKNYTIDWPILFNSKHVSVTKLQESAAPPEIFHLALYEVNHRTNRLQDTDKSHELDNSSKEFEEHQNQHEENKIRTLQTASNMEHLELSDISLKSKDLSNIFQHNTFLNNQPHSLKSFTATVMDSENDGNAIFKNNQLDANINKLESTDNQVKNIFNKVRHIPSAKSSKRLQIFNNEDFNENLTISNDLPHSSNKVTTSTNGNMFEILRKNKTSSLRSQNNFEATNNSISPANIYSKPDFNISAVYMIAMKKVFGNYLQNIELHSDAHVARDRKLQLADSCLDNRFNMPVAAVLGKGKQELSTDSKLPHFSQSYWNTQKEKKFSSQIKLENNTEDILECGLKTTLNVNEILNKNVNIDNSHNLNPSLLSENEESFLQTASSEGIQNITNQTENCIHPTDISKENILSYISGCPKSIPMYVNPIDEIFIKKRKFNFEEQVSKYNKIKLQQKKNTEIENTKSNQVKLTKTYQSKFLKKIKDETSKLKKINTIIIDGTKENDPNQLDLSYVNSKLLQSHQGNNKNVQNIYNAKNITHREKDLKNQSKESDNNVSFSNLIIKGVEEGKKACSQSNVEDIRKKVGGIRRVFTGRNAALKKSIYEEALADYYSKKIADTLQLMLPKDNVKDKPIETTAICKGSGKTNKSDTQEPQTHVIKKEKSSHESQYVLIKTYKPDGSNWVLAKPVRLDFAQPDISSTKAQNHSIMKENKSDKHSINLTSNLVKNVNEHQVILNNNNHPNNQFRNLPESHVSGQAKIFFNTKEDINKITQTTSEVRSLNKKASVVNADTITASKQTLEAPVMSISKQNECKRMAIDTKIKSSENSNFMLHCSDNPRNSVKGCEAAQSVASSETKEKLSPLYSIKYFQTLSEPKNQYKIISLKDKHDTSFPCHYKQVFTVDDGNIVKRTFKPSTAINVKENIIPQAARINDNSKNPKHFSSRYEVSNRVETIGHVSKMYLKPGLQESSKNSLDSISNARHYVTNKKPCWTSDYLGLSQVKNFSGDIPTASKKAFAQSNDIEVNRKLFSNKSETTTDTSNILDATVNTLTNDDSVIQSAKSINVNDPRKNIFDKIYLKKHILPLSKRRARVTTEPIQNSTLLEDSAEIINKTEASSEMTTKKSVETKLKSEHINESSQVQKTDLGYQAGQVSRNTVNSVISDQKNKLIPNTVDAAGTSNYKDNYPKPSHPIDIDEPELKGIQKYFNSKTLRGRANVAKLTYAAIGVFGLYYYLRSKLRGKPDVPDKTCKPTLSHGPAPTTPLAESYYPFQPPTTPPPYYPPNGYAPNYQQPGSYYACPPNSFNGVSGPNASGQPVIMYPYMGSPYYSHPGVIVIPPPAYNSPSSQPNENPFPPSVRLIE